MVFNVTFIINNISVTKCISRRPILLVEVPAVPGKNNRPVTNPKYLLDKFWVLIIQKCVDHGETLGFY